MTATGTDSGGALGAGARTQPATLWEKIKAFFSDSEIVFWARFQVFIGAAGSVMSTVDWTMFVFRTPTTGELLAFGGALLHGIFLEYLRRRRATDL